MGQVARANLLQNRQNGGVCPGAVLINLEDMLQNGTVISGTPAGSKPVWAFTYAPLRDWCR